MPISAHAKRMLVWTPGASHAMAFIGNTSDAHGQTWQLPVDHDRLNYRQLIEMASGVTGRRIGYTTVPKWAFDISGWIDSTAKEIEELLPRYRQDNVFDSAKVQTRFPDFPITTYREGITQLLGGSGDQAKGYRYTARRP